jgi:surfeit locus 1 family protein
MRWLLIFFRGRQLWLTPLVLLGACFLCSLGAWQWDRHVKRAERNALIDSRLSEPPILLTPGSVDLTTLDYRRVTLRGTFDNEHAVLLRNRAYDGATGYHLITPLRLSGSTGNEAVVLVDRGWVPYTETSREARRIYDLDGEVVIEGVARQSEANLGGPVDPPFTADRQWLDAWFRVNIERISAQIGYPLLPVFVEIQPGPVLPAAPPIPAATTDLGLGSHLNYTLQWYSFATILVGGYIFLTLRGFKPREQRLPPRRADSQYSISEDRS